MSYFLHRQTFFLHCHASCTIQKNGTECTVLLGEEKSTREHMDRILISER